MDNFELINRKNALKAITIWNRAGDAFFKKYFSNDAHRFALTCKTRGLIAHDRVLTGRIA